MSQKSITILQRCSATMQVAQKLIPIVLDAHRIQYPLRTWVAPYSYNVLQYGHVYTARSYGYRKINDTHRNRQTP